MEVGSVPSVSNLSGDLEGDVLTLMGTATDGGGDIVQADVTLQDDASQTVADTGVFAANVGSATTATFTLHISNLDNFPTAVIATVVLIDSHGERSSPVSVNFGAGDPSGPQITAVSISDSGVLSVKGRSFVEPLQLEINGQIVAPPLTIKANGAGSKLKIPGSPSTLNLKGGTNRVRLFASGLKSNIFVYSF
jgi:hypothetical protein